MGKNLNERDEVACPACAEPILRGARKCKHCGEWVPPAPANSSQLFGETTASSASAEPHPAERSKPEPSSEPLPLAPVEVPGVPNRATARSGQRDNGARRVRVTLLGALPFGSFGSLPAGSWEVRDERGNALGRLGTGGKPLELRLRPGKHSLSWGPFFNRMTLQLRVTEELETQFFEVSLESLGLIVKRVKSAPPPQRNIRSGKVAASADDGAVSGALSSRERKLAVAFVGLCIVSVLGLAAAASLGRESRETTAEYDWPAPDETEKKVCAREASGALNLSPEEILAWTSDSPGITVAYSDCLARRNQWKYDAWKGRQRRR